MGRDHGAGVGRACARGRAACARRRPAASAGSRPGPAADPELPAGPAAVRTGRSQITNLGTTTVEPGRLINVFAIQAGPSAGSLALSAPLPPGASVSVRLAGTALLARGCVANAQ
jgi:hypothetical protein